jgi:hypothetical protein
MRALLVPALLCLLSAFPSAADDRLFVRPWAELEPIVRIEPEYPIPVQKARLALLEEARVLLSAMVYGWTFLYTPADRERGVQEVFSLEAVAEIPWGHPGLAALESEVQGTKLYGRFSYAMSPDEMARRTAWQATTTAGSTGRGSASVFEGPAARRAALAAAVREAVRLHLNTRVLNRPREIRGAVVLWEDPQTVVRSGTWTTTARVRLQVDEILPYRIF